MSEPEGRTVDDPALATVAERTPEDPTGGEPEIVSTPTRFQEELPSPTTYREKQSGNLGTIVIWTFAGVVGVVSIAAVALLFYGKGPETKLLINVIQALAPLLTPPVSIVLAFYFKSHSP